MPKHAGGKRTKTSSITVRVSDRVKHGVDLVGRLYGESHSDVVNRALKNLLESDQRSVLIVIDGKPTDLLRETFCEHDWERFLRLAAIYPAALSEEEKIVWSRIKADKTYWKKSGNSVVLDIERAKADEAILRQE